jgi:hypothetical protein
MKQLLPAIFLLILALPVHAQRSGLGHVHTSKNDSLGALARATTLEQLVQRWKADPKDFPHRAVHAAMYCKLRGPDADSVLIASMPDNGREMDSFYDSQDIYDAQGNVQWHDEAVNDAYHAYYRCLADAVARNPDELPRFLEMIHSFDYVDNVDEWPWLCGLASRLYQIHPRQYMIAATKLSGELRSEAIACRVPPDAP